MLGQHLKLKNENKEEAFLPVLALLVILQFMLDHVNHNLIANQSALVHDLLGLPAQLGLARDLRP